MATSTQRRTSREKVDVRLTENDRKLLARLSKKYPTLNRTDLMRMAILKFAEQEGVAA